MSLESAFCTASLVCVMAAALASGCSSRAPGIDYSSKLSSMTPAGLVATPPSEATLKHMTIDFEGDGAAETITVQQRGERVAIFISRRGESADAWSMDLPEHAVFSDLQAQDMDADGRLELLVNWNGPGPDETSLAVVRWLGVRGEIVAPRGGPLDGSSWFRSRYYPPWIGDLMGDTTYEIVISTDSPDPSFLDSIVYEWDGREYVKSDLYLMPPRIVATRSAE